MAAPGLARLTSKAFTSPYSHIFAPLDNTMAPLPFVTTQLFPQTFKVNQVEAHM